MSFNLKSNTQHFQSHGVVKIILWESTCWQVLSSFVGIPKNQKRTSGKGFNGYSQSGSIHTGTSRSQGQLGLPAGPRKAGPARRNPPAAGRKKPGLGGSFREGEKDAAACPGSRRGMDRRSLDAGRGDQWLHRYPARAGTRPDSHAQENPHPPQWPDRSPGFSQHHL